jgi:hypothetical protein
MIDYKKLFCVISIDTYGEHRCHGIQTNSAWTKNPYGAKYAVVPSNMVEGIMATKGYCDIILNDDKTEVVSFTAREIPEPDPMPEPISQEERIEALENALLELALGGAE